MNILEMLDGGTGFCPKFGFAVFQNKDGTTTKLNWQELKLDENGKKYSYNNIRIRDNIIGYDAFNCNINLVSMEIPDSVKIIDTRAFFCCGKLNSIVIPDSLARIRADAFFGCLVLRSIKYKGQTFNSVSDFVTYL